MPDLSQEQRAEDLSGESFPAAKGGSFTKRGLGLHHDGIRYASRSEVICSLLLKIALPDWRPIEGRTYDVPIGFGKKVDFYIPENDHFIEYHPINLSWEIQERKSSGQIRWVLNKIPRGIAEVLEEALGNELRFQYFKKRRFALDYGDHPDSRLTVCCTPEEFVERILVPLGCSRAEMLAEWKRLNKVFKK